MCTARLIMVTTIVDLSNSPRLARNVWTGKRVSIYQRVMELIPGMELLTCAGILLILRVRLMTVYGAILSLIREKTVLSEDARIVIMVSGLFIN